jgi:hydroxymethylglutaryl-CoA reductase
MSIPPPIRSSRVPGFFKYSMVERTAMVAQWANLTPQEQSTFFGLMGLSLNDADNMIENVIGVHALPLGIAVNFLINQKDYLIPMVIEEPSVVAALSNAAKLVREGGGFQAESTEPIMIGQIQIFDPVAGVQDAARDIDDNKDWLIDGANKIESSIVKRGGGVIDLETRVFEDTPAGPMLVVHVHMNVLDAMGANAINTVCERLGNHLEIATGGRVNLRILSNLSDKRRASATCIVPAAALDTETMQGSAVVDAIVEASIFAEVDPYRAATHNKGVMNGIDALAIATGNDWRAIEAGAHAFAAREGRYTSMTTWRKNTNGDLTGSIDLPMAVGIVGGATKSHPTARVSLKVLRLESARELSEVMVCVGLAQNLSALRALATEGIQRGHMSLHARQMVMAAGATPEMVNEIVNIMIAEGNIRQERANELVAQFK